MKKLILIIILIITIITLNQKQEELIIPKEAIRFRVIANSNNITDQNTKLLIRNTIQKHIQEDLKESNSIKQSRTIIQNKVNNYENIIKETLNKNNIETDFSINYGMNYFPEKIYKGVKYEEGYYESLVINLGSANGNNWWCVLFPPLCLLEAEENEETTEVEYKFFISELIDKYLK